MNSKMKQIFFFLIIIGFASLQACGPSEKEIKLVEFKKQKKINESKFYYPKPYDHYWRTYQPNLIDSQGWITNECKDSENLGEKVVVIGESLSHMRWGNYKGQLRVEIIEKKKRISIDFECFKPDFSFGEWLSTKY